jgi:predicted nucleic acid-binding protein
MHPVILDTGPLVAFLNSRDTHHEWTKHQWATIKPPLLTCESVLAEACYLIRNAHDGAERVFELISRGILRIDFDLAAEADQVKGLIKRYSNVPMSLADACLVRMVEKRTRATVLTLDSDFKFYRTHDRRVIPVIMPT